MVKKAVDNQPDRAKKKIIERLNKIDKELIDCYTTFNGTPTYNGNNISWFENSLNYHSIQPFDGIITNNNSDYPYVCDISGFDIDSNIIFKTPSKVQRTADEMARISKQLLQHGKEIHFVDPHFEKLNQRHFRPLIRFLETVFARIGNIRVSKIIYHTGNLNIDDSGIKEVIDRKILTSLPIGASISFVRWPSQ